MPKLVRSRNHHSLSVPLSPSAFPSPPLLPLQRPQHVHCTEARRIPCLSYYSPLTPPWDTAQQQRKVSEEDMCQNHATTGTDENRDGSCISSSGDDCDQRISQSLSLVSSASSSTTSLRRRKPSVCLTDLVQQDMKESSRNAISPIMTNLNHRDVQTINDQLPQDLYSIHRSELGNASPSGWWGHFTSTTNADEFFDTEFEDEGHDDIVNVVPESEDSWDYNAMAHSTSFMPIKERPYRHRAYGGGGSGNTPTSWRVALASSYHTTNSKSMIHDHRNHPYINRNSYPMMKRQSIKPLSSTSQRLSVDRCSTDSNIHAEQPPPLLNLSVSSSSFDEFVLTCPSHDSNDNNNSTSSMEIATQRMSVLGL